MLFGVSSVVIRKWYRHILAFGVLLLKFLQKALKDMTLVFLNRVVILFFKAVILKKAMVLC